jgi:hypothetical protein
LLQRRFRLALRQHRDDDPARGDDDQPPRRRFRRAQKAQHGAVEMARQGRADAGEFRHGDEHGQHPLQRFPVFLDRSIPVHRASFGPNQGGGIVARGGEVWIK